MPAIKLEQFGGMLPAWDAHLLPPGQCISGQNCYLFSGALTGWRQPKLLRTLSNSAAKMVYRVPLITKNTASAVLMFLSQPSEGDTVSVGEETYTFTATVSAAYTVLIGANAAASATNLLAALTTDQGTSVNEAVLYGLATEANPAVAQSGNSQDVFGGHSYIKVLASDFGAAYNATLVAESTGGNRLKWVADLGAAQTTTMSGGTNASFNSSPTAPGYWLEFVDEHTDIIRSPVVDDKFGRYYFASPSVPPEYNTYDRIAAGQHAWLLGVPPPGCAPIVGVEGGGSSATLGHQTGGGADANFAGNYMVLMPVTPVGAMQLNDVAFTPNSTDATVTFRGVIYADDNGAPGAFIGVSVEQTGFTAAAQSTCSFLNPPPLTQETKYWIGIMFDGAITITGAATDTSDTLYFANTYTNGAPATAPAGTVGPSVVMWGDLTTSDVVEARAYVYTYVTEYDEESSPSPATVLDGWSNGTWTIGLFQPLPDDVGVLRNVKTINLYRTIPGVSGSTVFFLVKDKIPVGTASYTDTVLDDVIALNAQMQSTNWFPPPESMIGMINMPNGMVAGFRNNEIWFCEPYRPHAWPPGYVITTEFPIVGLGVSGQALVVCTGECPYIAQGVNPGVVTLMKIPEPEPCASRGSIVSNSQGVVYMSPNGLINVKTLGSADNTTDEWFTRERWLELAPQGDDVHAIQLLGGYLAFDVIKGFWLPMAPDNKSFGIWPQPGGHRIGFMPLTQPSGFNVDNLLLDPWSGIGLVVQNGAVYYWDFADVSPTIIPYTWRSKAFQQVAKNNFEAIKVYFSVPPGTPALNATRKTDATNDPSWDTLDADRYGYIRVFADGQLVTAREIRKSGELLRVLGGFKTEDWQVEVTARVLISNVQFGTSVKELAQV